MGGGISNNLYIIKKQVLKSFHEISNYYYSCIDSECKIIPEILKINYEKSLIKINCPIHGENNINIQDYFNKDNKNHIYNIECENKCQGGIFVQNVIRLYANHV